MNERVEIVAKILRQHVDVTVKQEDGSLRLGYTCEEWCSDLCPFAFRAAYVHRVHRAMAILEALESFDAASRTAHANYANLVASSPRVPRAVKDWVRDHEDMGAGFLAGRWYAMDEDTIGGFCVMPLPFPPSTGLPTVASFMGKKEAVHIAALHNQWLESQKGQDA